MTEHKEAARWLLSCTITCLVLAACSATTPLGPTPAIRIDSPLSAPTTLDVTPESTTFESPVQTPTNEALEASPITHIAIVDQASTVDTSRAGWWSIKNREPVGQTFKPALAGLDTIALWTEDQWREVCSGLGARLQVRLHEATIDGPLIAVSSAVDLPGCFKGITFFRFPYLIPLAPDKVYAIEVVVTVGDNWGVVWQQDPEAYPRGTAIVLGDMTNADIAFQEGLRDSTPRTEAYCQNDLWQHVKRADGSAFKNQGDCIQYLNTGR